MEAKLEKIKQERLRIWHKLKSTREQKPTDDEQRRKYRTKLEKLRRDFRQKKLEYEIEKAKRLRESGTPQKQKQPDEAREGIVEGRNSDLLRYLDKTTAGLCAQSQFLTRIIQRGVLNERFRPF